MQLSVEDIRGLVYQAAGVGSAAVMQLARDVVMPTEEIEAGLTKLLAEVEQRSPTLDTPSPGRDVCELERRTAIAVALMLDKLAKIADIQPTSVRRIDRGDDGFETGKPIQTARLVLEDLPSADAIRHIAMQLRGVVSVPEEM